MGNAKNRRTNVNEDRDRDTISEQSGAKAVRY